jgi:hypothetical protein
LSEEVDMTNQRVSRWGWAALAATLALGGCASRVETVPDERLTQLPPAARQAVIAEEQRVNIAQQNVVAARVALDEAQRFRDVTRSELRAANARLDAANKELALARSARTPPQHVERAEEAQRSAAMELAAARAKRDYAERLISLRSAQLDEVTSELAVARADAEMRKIQELARRGLATPSEVNRFAEVRARSQADLARNRRLVAELSTVLASARENWEARRREYNTAARAEPPALLPPPPPEQLPINPPNQ